VVYLDSTGVVMRAFDSLGNTSGASVPTLLKPGPVNLTATAEHFVVAGAGNVMWLVWLESPVAPSTLYTLMARPFDASGQALAAASVLSSRASPTGVQSLMANGAAGHAIVSWGEGLTTFYALMQGAAAPTVHSPGISSGLAAAHFPAATTSGAALTWVNSDINTGRAQPFGTIFDAAGEPLFSVTGGIPGASESLALPWITSAVTVHPAVGGASTLDLLTIDFAQLWPGDQPAPLTVLTEITPAARPLAASPQAKLLARGALPLTTGRSMVASLSGNVLVFVEEPSGVTVTSVWRRP